MAGTATDLRSVIPGVATVLIERGEILLARRAGLQFHGKWCVPCGHVIEGESLEEAARREFAEETGLAVEIGHVLFAHLSFQIPDKPVLGVWFEATRLGGTLAANDDAMEAAFFPLNDLPEDLAFTGDRLLLARLQQERAGP